jgi:hypothetical protein
MQEARGCKLSILIIADDGRARITILLNNDVQCCKLVGGDSVPCRRRG